MAQPRIIRAIPLLILALILASPSLSLAADWYIKPDGSGTVPTIQAAVDVAQDGDRIILADGRFLGEENRHILVRKDLQIYSESGDPSQCIIDCSFEQVGTVDRNGFDFRDSNSVLMGVTIEGGPSDFGGWIGGAILIVEGSPSIQNCVFRDNVADQGGAINCQTASPTIENCVFINNRSKWSTGGALCFTLRSSPLIKGCTIVANTSHHQDFGGAISLTSGSIATIESSIIAFNRNGVAVLCAEESSAVLRCCNIFGNGIGSGDWVGYIAGQLDHDANFSADPLFCDVWARDYSLQSDSPCAPPGITGCGLVGALPVGCRVLSLEAESWGKIKASYRE